MDDKESFIRWQGITISQLGYAINLILSFAIASLGFTVTLLMKKDFILETWQKCTFLLALISLLLSIGFGIFCVVNRLRDFRKTAKIARKREKNANDPELPSLRAITDRLEKITWNIFWFQVLTFGVGVLLVVSGFTGALSVKM